MSNRGWSTSRYGNFDFPLSSDFFFCFSAKKYSIQKIENEAHTKYSKYMWNVYGHLNLESSLDECYVEPIEILEQERKGSQFSYIGNKLTNCKL